MIALPPKTHISIAAEVADLRRGFGGYVSRDIGAKATATHLLRAGVDVGTIRAWLGHVSINTTNIYAETDFEMKAKALSLWAVKGTRTSKHWRDNPNLMSFLAQIQPKVM